MKVISEKPQNGKRETSFRSAWVFTANHGADDQQSLNIVVKDMLNFISEALNQTTTSSSKTVKNEPILLFNKFMDDVFKIKNTKLKNNEVLVLSNQFNNIATTTSTTTTSIMIDDESTNTNKLFPPCIEDAISPELPGLTTLVWSVYQLFNSAAGAQVLPNNVISLYKSNKNGEEFANKYLNPNNRITFVETFILSPEVTKKVLRLCRSNNVTITHLLSAITLALTSVFFQINKNSNHSNNIETNKNSIESQFIKGMKLRFLLSVGLRPFGKNNSNNSNSNNGSNNGSNNPQDFTDGTVACASGAIDYVLPVSDILAKSTYQVYKHHTGVKDNGQQFNKIDDFTSFWLLAKTCKDTANNLIQNYKFIPESVRLFGLGMKYAEILPLVENEAKNPATLGRRIRHVKTVSYTKPQMYSFDVRCPLKSLKTSEKN